MCSIFLIVLNVCTPQNTLDFCGNYVNRKIDLIKTKKKKKESGNHEGGFVPDFLRKIYMQQISTGIPRNTFHCYCKSKCICFVC